jgi:hypothetical protein
MVRATDSRTTQTRRLLGLFIEEVRQPPRNQVGGVFERFRKHCTQLFAGRELWDGRKVRYQQTREVAYCYDCNCMEMIKIVKRNLRQALPLISQPLCQRGGIDIPIHFCGNDAKFQSRITDLLYDDPAQRQSLVLSMLRVRLSLLFQGSLLLIRDEKCGEDRKDGANCLNPSCGSRVTFDPTT